MEMPLEGLHTETGPGVLEAAIEVDDALSRRRQGGAVQDLDEGARAAARLDGDLHGEVVARLAGPVRPSSLLAERKDGKPVFHDAKAPHMTSPTPCAGSSAGSRR